MFVDDYQHVSEITGTCRIYRFTDTNLADEYGLATFSGGHGYVVAGRESNERKDFQARRGSRQPKVVDRKAVRLGDFALPQT